MNSSSRSQAPIGTMERDQSASKVDLTRHSSRVPKWLDQTGLPCLHHRWNKSLLSSVVPVPCNPSHPRPAIPHLKCYVRLRPRPSVGYTETESYPTNASRGIVRRLRRSTLEKVST
jgi:hypothetical protein